ncbi:MAG: CDP-diacylglycerol--serine O-phosphatidyltransferase [Bacteroidetes bacterium]|nr:CDP-diacylglycerol--serine O-phosphatidyltransferase [Bacteroidota bacterium]
MNIKKHIPNAITCGNLLCGCLAIVKAFEGDLVWSAYLVGIALVLDFFDGFTARLLNVSSPIGKDLDSLADMVTFGVLPAVVMYKLCMTIENASLSFDYVPNQNYWMYYFCFIIAIFSAVRLAKFNNDKGQSDSFIGLPTPANAMFICSIPLIQDKLMHTYFEVIYTPYVLCLVSLILSLLLVAPIPLLALKFKNFGWDDNKLRFILIGLSVVCLVVFQFVGIPMIIILYILLSIVNNIFFKKQV